ncbi:hypothetical protein QYE76_028823 [Lolium multiflorum]|uniref:Dirigent protein n=1 Tax=Lolium multiflorum TaxID=4521 RepID=A0AAD8VHM5_LOLMU|nr:hypothetical protein QYE76_028823 [Lolium multiflorum]
MEGLTASSRIVLLVFLLSVAGAAAHARKRVVSSSSDEPCTKMTLYLHDILYNGVNNSANATAAPATKPTALSTTHFSNGTFFGMLVVFDDLVTQGKALPVGDEERGTRARMNRQWMYIDRRFDEFTAGLDNFMAVAEANKHGGFMYYPCVDCKNTVNYARSSLIHSHLLRSGFMPSYYCWTKHGERGVMMEDNDEEEEDDDGYPNFPEYDDTAEGNEDNEVEDQEAPDEPADDDLGRAIADARRECETEKERLAFDKMIEDHNKLLYPTCEDGHKKLGSTLELLQWKAENGVTDSGFGKLLTIIKRKLPRGNELPASTYEAKKIVCPLGLDVQKIHACINDCILYRDEYENLDACPVCTALRYKIRRDDPGDVEGERPRKRVPAKVMWPEGSISKGYGTEEVIEFCVDFIPDLKPIGVPESRHEGRLSGKGTLGRKSMICHMASIVSLTLREAEALCASNYPCPPGYRVPTGWLLSVGGVPVPPVPLGVAREMAITNHYYFELTPEQRRNPQWHPDYSPTWESFFINRRERALARHEEGGPPPSNFNEAGRRLWWRDRTLQGVMAHRGPRLRYPQSQPTRALPPRFDYRDPDASDDDDGDYDDYRRVL